MLSDVPVVGPLIAFPPTMACARAEIPVGAAGSSGRPSSSAGASGSAGTPVSAGTGAAGSAPHTDNDADAGP
jgi:hypothetical protein